MQQAGASVRSEYLGPVAPHPPWRPWMVSTKSRSMRDRQSKGQNLHTKFGLLHHALIGMAMEEGIWRHWSRLNIPI